MTINQQHKNSLTLYVFIALLLNFALGFYIGFNRNKNLGSTQKDTVLITTTTTLNYDSGVKHIPTNPKPTIIYYPNYIKVEPKVDTAAILTEWLNHLVVYNDSIRNNELAAYIADSIYQNRIIHRSFAYQILRPDSVITKTITIKETPLWYASMHLGLQYATPLHGGSAQLLPTFYYQHKRFGAMVAVNNNYAAAGLTFKIN